MKKILLVLFAALLSGALSGQILHLETDTIASCHWKDTINVLLIVCDTTEFIYNDFPVYTANGVRIDTISSERVPASSGYLYWTRGLEVREKHNTIENEKYDAYGKMCVDGKGNVVSCYYDYWVHIKYLYEDKTEIPEYIVVWQKLNSK